VKMAPIWGCPGGNAKQDEWHSRQQRWKISAFVRRNGPTRGVELVYVEGKKNKTTAKILKKRKGTRLILHILVPGGKGEKMRDRASPP